MGVAISGWQLARAVSLTGQLGVVSGTALEVLCTRRLQAGDPGGHVRRALAAFPAPDVADWILSSYFVAGGIDAETPYRQVPRHTLTSSPRLLQLTTAANFVEVFLAKEGHTGLVGVNYLRKIELPLPAALYGALLAGVDHVLVGAGSPAEVPETVRRLAGHEPAAWSVRVQGAGAEDRRGEIVFDPATVLPDPPGRLALPQVLAIVASTDLARALAADPRTRPDGFVVEGPTAGGHNAPPRGPRRVDALGQPVYDERDDVDVASLVELGLPVWLAGSYGTPERFRAARALGAAGVQVGTAFAYCDESGFDSTLKEQVRGAIADGTLRVRADWRASPTGFPFRVAEVSGTLTDPDVLAERAPVCDLGILRSAFVRGDRDVEYRCPAEPTSAYERKGGRSANSLGRLCLCNALFASAGFGQRRPHGVVEPALVTSGSDLTVVAELMRVRGPNRSATGYRASDVVDHILGDDVLGDHVAAP
jgi:NAD(P)H-dependent flavin oxidoreductase YrpB (nitropropane dioxygenase family)